MNMALRHVVRVRGILLQEPAFLRAGEPIVRSPHQEIEHDDDHPRPVGQQARAGDPEAQILRMPDVAVHPAR